MIRRRGRFNSRLVAYAAMAFAMAGFSAVAAEAQAKRDPAPAPAGAAVPLPLPRDLSPGVAGATSKAAPEAGSAQIAAATPPSPPLPPIRPSAPIAVAGAADAPASSAAQAGSSGVPLPPIRPVTPSSAVSNAFASFGPQRSLRVVQPGETQLAALTPTRAPLPLDAPTPLGTTLSGPAAADADCRALAAEGTAVFTPKPAFGRVSGCGASAPVELKAVRRKDGGLVTFQPAAVMRCSMARAAAAYVRDDLAPAAAAGGMTLDQVDVAASYDCRGRNRVRGAKLSEHGRANALDIRGFGFVGGRDHGVYSKSLPGRLRSILMPSACNRFNTVLGPGSDGYHEDHLHMDLMERRRAGSKTCRWRGA